MNILLLQRILLIATAVALSSCTRQPIASRNGIDLLSSDVEYVGLSQGLKEPVYEWTVVVRNRGEQEQYLTIGLLGCTQGKKVLHRTAVDLTIPAGETVTHTKDGIMVSQQHSDAISQWLLTAPALGLH
jgi:hypothetical protein